MLVGDDIRENVLLSSIEECRVNIITRNIENNTAGNFKSSKTLIIAPNEMVDRSYFDLYSESGDIITIV